MTSLNVCGLLVAVQEDSDNCSDITAAAKYNIF